MLVFTIRTTKTPPPSTTVLENNSPGTWSKFVWNVTVEPGLSHVISGYLYNVGTARSTDSLCLKVHKSGALLNKSPSKNVS